MIDTKIKEERTQELRRTYREEAQIGLVLGAGVSYDSHVPDYLHMTLNLCQCASKNNMLSGAPSEALAFLQEQAEFIGDFKEALEAKDYERADHLKCKVVVQPEEVALFVKTYLGDEREQSLLYLVKEVLYEQVGTTEKKRMVRPDVIEQNKTLDSVICFCAALRGSVLASDSETRITTNRKVGGILTTNYDALVEAAFHSKFGLENRLKPVGRADSRESNPRRRVIPVYHIHGYVSYVPPKDDATGVKGSKELVIAQDDYFRTFYDPLGFSNYIAMSFLRRFPCLFIGSAMTDSNLRRFLYHLHRERGASSDGANHFAILKTRGSRDRFDDAVLSSYGVATIWIKDYVEIEKILREVYKSLGGNTAQEWEKLKAFKWTRHSSGLG